MSLTDVVATAYHLGALEREALMETLREDVFDLKSREAADTNNGGTARQLEYLSSPDLPVEDSLRGILEANGQGGAEIMRMDREGLILRLRQCVPEDRLSQWLDEPVHNMKAHEADTLVVDGGLAGMVQYLGEDHVRVAVADLDPPGPRTPASTLSDFGLDPKQWPSDRDELKRTLAEAITTSRVTWAHPQPDPRVLNAGIDVCIRALRVVETMDPSQRQPVSLPSIEQIITAIAGLPAQERASVMGALEDAAFMAIQQEVGRALQTMSSKLETVSRLELAHNRNLMGELRALVLEAQETYELQYSLVNLLPRTASQLPRLAEQMVGSGEKGEWPLGDAVGELIRRVKDQEYAAILAQGCGGIVRYLGPERVRQALKGDLERLVSQPVPRLGILAPEAVRRASRAEDRCRG